MKSSMTLISLLVIITTSTNAMEGKKMPGNILRSSSMPITIPEGQEGRGRLHISRRMMIPQLKKPKQKKGIDEENSQSPITSKSPIAFTNLSPDDPTSFMYVVAAKILSTNSPSPDIYPPK